MIRRNAGKARPCKATSFNSWHSRFRNIADDDAESSKLLRRWAFYGKLSEALPFLLYIYVTGSPTTSQSRAATKSVGDLAKQMENLAHAMRGFNTGQHGAHLRHALQELAEQKIAWKRSGRPDEVYDRLPRWLSGLALLFRAAAFDGTLSSPPDRKRIQTRALALLYFHASGSSEYSTASEIATILRPAYQASGLREDVTHDVVRQRMRRFRQGHPKDFSMLKQFVESGGLANNVRMVSILLMLPTFRSR